MLLGFVFVIIVIFVPEGVVPGLRRLYGQAMRGRRSPR
jgi:ABC-type branched-subunit amino acid transport system permease subunit